MGILWYVIRLYLSLYIQYIQKVLEYFTCISTIHCRLRWRLFSHERQRKGLCFCCCCLLHLIVKQNLSAGLRFHTFFKERPYKYGKSVNFCTYRSFDLTTNIVGMTRVLHKHKIAHRNRALFTYICCRKALGQLVAIWFECLPAFRKKIDIQMILQLSGCISATNICKHMFSTCEFMFMQHTTVIPTRQVFKSKDL